jgi:hypothetical protein
MAERFYELLNQKKFYIVYNNKQEIILFRCNENKLSSIPDTFWPFLKNCKRFSCKDNYLTVLPNTLSECIEINCSHNLLTDLPKNLYNCERLACSGNNLEYLPPLRKCTLLLSTSNNLFSDRIEDWVKIWKTRNIFYKWKQITRNKKIF